MALNPNVKWPAQTNAPTAAYTYGSAQNVTTPGDGTGTPFEEDLVNDWFGFQQELLDKAGITPSGNPDEVDDSDIYDAIRLTSGHPGLCVPAFLSVDPATIGLRVLYLDGTTVTAADYPDLVAATYVGDGNNATAEAFIKTSDAGGTTPNVAGPYFLLPDARGRFPRGYDIGATIDPDGATRFPGDTQADAVQNHYHQVGYGLGGMTYVSKYAATVAAGGAIGLQGGASDPIYAYSESPSSPLIDEETRPANFLVKWYVWY